MSAGSLDAHAEEVRERLEAKYEAREAAIAASRLAIRDAANAIRAVHRGDVDDADRLMVSANRQLAAARVAVIEQPILLGSGLLADAAKEYAEASLVRAALAGEDLPGPEDLSVDDVAWLGGLAETVGELRRAALDRLRSADVDDAERLVDRMETIYGVLVTMDYPEGITGGLRRQTDIARSIIERTRGDVTTARLQERLRMALEAHRGDTPGA